MRRIEAARLLREVPAMAEKIQDGSLNLSQIGEVSRAIKEKEKITGQKISCALKNDLVFSVTGKTISETQRDLAITLDIAPKEFERQKTQQDESVRLELTLSKEQYDLFLKCKDQAAHLLGQNNLDTSWASLFEVLATQFLGDVDATTSRSLKQVSNESPKNSKSRLAKPTRQSLFTSGAEVKSLSMKNKEYILKRDQCCQYHDPKTGKTCGSTYALEVDHKTSQWAGGTSNIKNLQVLCRAHNQYKYLREARKI
jgi:hypothetical protein